MLSVHHSNCLCVGGYVQRETCCSCLRHTPSVYALCVQHLPSTYGTCPWDAALRPSAVRFKPLGLPATHHTCPRPSVLYSCVAHTTSFRGRHPRPVLPVVHSAFCAPYLQTACYVLMHAACCILLSLRWACCVYFRRAACYIRVEHSALCGVLSAFHILHAAQPACGELCSDCRVLRSD